MNGDRPDLPWGERSVDDVLSLVGADVDHADLPSLTVDELGALGDRPAFGDVTELRVAETDTGETNAASAQRGLVARRLVWPAGEDLAVHPEVQVVLAVRSAPAFLTVVGLGAGGVGPRLRVWGGISGGGADDPVLLQRVVVAGVSDFVLGTATWVSRAVATFVLAPPVGRAGVALDDGSWAAVRPVETIAPGATETMRFAAYVARGSGALAPVADDGTTGEPEATDVDDLAERLRQSWARCADVASSPS